jgi:hypothetical protein
MSSPKQTEKLSLSISSVLVSGTEQAFDFTGTDNLCCSRCGSTLKLALVTEIGLLGGDCYATLTGDDTTRKEFRKLFNALNKFSAVVRVQISSLKNNGVSYLWTLKAFCQDGSQSGYFVGGTRTPGIAESVAVNWCEINGVQLETGE